ncbi:MAG: hypothetical protein ACE15D_19125 [Candidatus Eisenbacteria bacterium]
MAHEKNAPGDACRQILERICLEAGRTVDSPFCRDVARHLEICEKCRDQAASLRGTLGLVRCLEREDVPADVARRLRDALGLSGEAAS